MKLPDYIPVEEVRRVCSELGIGDWSAPSAQPPTREEAQKVLKEVNIENIPIDVDQFRDGLEVELEHGTRFSDANVTNNHPVLTGKIVIAHMKETLDYYVRLDVAEIEGDMAKAAETGNADKLMAKYRKLVAARKKLSDADAGRAS